MGPTTVAGMFLHDGVIDQTSGATAAANHQVISSNAAGERCPYGAVGADAGLTESAHQLRMDPRATGRRLAGGTNEGIRGERAFFTSWLW